MGNSVFGVLDLSGAGITPVLKMNASVLVEIGDGINLLSSLAAFSRNATDGIKAPLSVFQLRLRGFPSEVIQMSCHCCSVMAT